MSAPTLGRLSACCSSSSCARGMGLPPPPVVPSPRAIEYGILSSLACVSCEATKREEERDVLWWCTTPQLVVLCAAGAKAFTAPCTRATAAITSLIVTMVGMFVRSERGDDVPVYDTKQHHHRRRRPSKQTSHSKGAIQGWITYFGGNIFHSTMTEAFAISL